MAKSVKQQKHLERLAEMKRGTHLSSETKDKISKANTKGNPNIRKFCRNCGKEFFRANYNGNKEWFKKFKERKYCSLYCARHSKDFKERLTKNSRGCKNGNWKGGRNIGRDGYVEIWQPHHPQANSNGYVLEHRLVMEKKIGRFLKKSERVHHINEVKDDNRPENLRLFKNCGYHISHHLGRIA
jgi:hypothetical protein